MFENFVSNNDIKIHYIETNKDNDICVLIIPGMINSAEQLFEYLGESLNYHCFFMSVRGRGKSSSPSSNYSFEDQISDIDAIIKNLDLKKIYIYGQSVGASLALGYSLKEKNINIKGLILGDYPPIYTPIDDNWKNEIINESQNTLSDVAMNELIKDSNFVNLIPELSKINIPILILRGELEGSALSEQDLIEFKGNSENISIDCISNSSHDIYKSEDFIKKISDFINNNK